MNVPTMTMFLPGALVVRDCCSWALKSATAKKYVFAKNIHNSKKNKKHISGYFKHDLLRGF